MATATPYSGKNKYVMHFNKGETPPFYGFWSPEVTDRYGEFFFVENPLNRYNVSSRSKFTHKPDGSIDLYIQNESPGKDRQGTGCPHRRQIISMLRRYWPKVEDPSTNPYGTWKPPAIEKAS